jgi:mono/diheme cytochrome c family protein
LRGKNPALACAMLRDWKVLCIVSSLSFVALAILHSSNASGLTLKSVATSRSLDVVLRETRSSPLDLEIGGELAGLAAGSTRYLTRGDLLALPQVEYRVTDDANFTGPTRVGGVLLDELARRLAAAPDAALVAAICDDRYRAHYPQAYVAAHHPVLVLTIDGKGPEGWPKDSEGHGMSMGPYLISHPKFAPSFQILSHADEPQIPWGVVRLEFRNEKVVFGAIAPGGAHAGDQAVRDGYRIAQQNCYRCHNMWAEGGQKAGRPWLVLSAWASAGPERFAAYVRDPKSKNPRAEMPGFPKYDDATIAALRAYFQTFTEAEAGKP